MIRSQSHKRVLNDHSTKCALYFHYQLHIQQYSKVWGFLDFALLRSKKCGLISMLWDKVQAETDPQIQRGNHYTIGTLIHWSNSRSSIKMIVVNPGESLTCISNIYVARSSSSHWPWQNYRGNMVTRVSCHRVLFTVQHFVFLFNISCFIAPLNTVYLNEFIIFATANTMHAHKILSWLNSLT